MAKRHDRAAYNVSRPITSSRRPKSHFGFQTPLRSTLKCVRLEQVKKRNKKSKEVLRCIRASEYRNHTLKALLRWPCPAKKRLPTHTKPHVKSPKNQFPPSPSFIRSPPLQREQLSERAKAIKPFAQSQSYFSLTWSSPSPIQNQEKVKMSTEAAVNGHEATQVFAEGAAPVEHKEEGVKVSDRSLSIRGCAGRWTWTRFEVASFDRRVDGRCHDVKNIREALWAHEARLYASVIAIVVTLIGQ